MTAENYVQAIKDLSAENSASENEDKNDSEIDVSFYADEFDPHSEIEIQERKKAFVIFYPSVLICMKIIFEIR